MVKRHLPKYVYPHGRKGYLYFRRKGVLHRMPDDPTSAEFWTEYAKLLRGTPVRPARRNVKKLIASYVQSDKWERLAANTQKSYRQSFRYLEERIGHIDPAALRRVHVMEMRDALSGTPTTANRRVAVLSVLMEHAIDLDWIDRNPAKGVSALQGKREARQPWPRDMIEAFREEADGTTLLLFEMLLGTGQRVNDVLAMQWGHVEDDGLWVVPSKTKRKRKNPLYIPFTDRLRAILADTPKRGLHIVTQANGRPVSYQLAWKWISDVRKAIGAEKWDIHALRHSAASEIAAIEGMTDEHVQAITGHSARGMVQLYAGAARQKARAIEAQKRRK